MKDQIYFISGHRICPGKHAGTILKKLLVHHLSLVQLLSVVLVALGIGMMSTAAQAQIPITGAAGVGASGGAAFDHHGNAYYIGESAPSYISNQVYKVTYSNGTFSASTLIATLPLAAQHLAVDDSGNLYVIGSYNSLRKETLSGGSYTESVLYTGLSSPQAIAFDGSGNLYVKDGNRILKGSSSGGFSQIVSGLSFAGGMSVDSAGNIYVTDSDNNQVLKYPSSGGNSPQTLAVTGDLSAPRGIAVDDHGTIYVSDYNHGRVLKETPSPDGSYTARLFDKYTSLSGSHATTDLAANSEGDALIAFQPSGSGVGGLLGYETSSQDKASFDFTSVPLGTNATKAVTLTLGTGGSLDHLSVTTLGAGGMDFASADGGTCAAGSTYSTGDTCTVNVVFSPRQAGVRYGAVSLLDASGNVLTTTYIYGTGTGPQLTLDAYQITYLGTAFSNPTLNTQAVARGIAVDAAGAVYLADYGNKRVLKEALSGSPAETVIADGLAGPQGIAVDGAGNVYVSDGVDYVSGSGDVQSNGTLLKLTPSSSGNYIRTTLASGLQYPRQIAVDSNGNLYLAQYGVTGANASAILKFTLLPTGDYTQSTAVQIEADGIAVDANGNLYLGTPDSQGNGGVYKATRTAEGDYTLGSSQLFSGYGGVALDGAGNVYSINSASGGTAQITRAVAAPDGTYTTTEIIAISRGRNGDEIAVDGAGNVYVTGAAASQQQPTGGTFTVYPAAKVTMDNPSTLDFGSNQVGHDPGFGNDHFVWVGNIGTDPLTFAAPASGNNPTLAPADFYVESNYGGCTQAAPGSAVTLSTGESCRYLIDFKPSRAGEIDGTMTFTDNDRNVANASQTVSLKGLGEGAGSTNTLSVSVPSLSISSGTAATVLTATISFTAGDPTGAVTFTLNGSSPVTATCSAGTNTESCTASYPTATLSVGSYPIPVSIAADSNYGAASGTGTLTVTAASSGPKAILSPTNGAFGGVSVGSTSDPKAFTLASGGDVDLAISSITITGANASSFRISANTCGETLAPSHSCSIYVTFEPTAVGDAAGTLSVVDSAGTQTATLDGAGTSAAAPQANLSPTSVSFGSVNTGATSTTQTFTLKNGGSATLPINSIRITGTDASLFVIGGNTCGSTLDAGGSCSIGVSFKPSAAGDATATLTVVDSIGTQTASLSGTGIAGSSATDFHIAVASNQQTVQRGASASYAIQLVSADPSNPFTSAVTLSASGLPAGASATFSPASLVPGTTQATTSTMTVTVPVLSAELKDSPPRPLGGLPAVASLACVIVLWPLRRGRRGLSLLILLIVGIACAAGLTGCGSGTGFAPPGLASTISVTGTSGSTTHTTTVTLKVN